ncbi:nose resistant to fluoxetine protein 6-like [Epargyreus clarus]|uniref:nose resistant to fluoxetine protein 6-like n=1 Tax=Epargyreus clarus TaxID=520877 RepID=UPI003C2B2ED4
MKFFTLVYVVFAVLTKSKCYVVAPTKDVEITTVSQNQADSTIKNDKLNSTKDLMRDDSVIYLDDVIFALKHQNWTQDEQPCLDQTLRLLYNLQNSTLWAVWEWDSTSSEPEGILFGNRYHLGNFDECLSAPWHDTHPDLRTQYCLAEIVLERHDKKPVKRHQDPYNPHGSALNYIESPSKFKRPLNRVTWGACVPVSCSSTSVVRLLEILLARSYVGAAGLRARISVTEECQKVDESRQYNGLFYGFIFVGREIIQACCLRENFNSLCKVQKDGVEVLYGVRFLSMCVIVIGHQYGMFSGGPVSNGYNVDKDAMTIIGMIFLHDDIVVDAFFFLSGFLAAKGIVKLKRIPNIFIIFLKRYVRLVVAYAAIIFFIVGVFPYTGSGPLWNRTVAGETEPCLENWWLSLLMLSNYVNSNNMCFVISWYIPCDFHFFVITILLYCIYKKLPGFGSVCITIVTIAAIIVPGVINYVYKLPAIQLFTYEFLTNPRNQTQFHISYIKSHNRYASYLIGFFCGYYFTTRSISGDLKSISRKWSVFGATISIVVMLFVMLSGPALVWTSYGLVVDAIYAALNRPVWTLSLAILVFCCSLGKVPIVKNFLSWYPWVPLSRLAYGLYLTHALIITRNVQITRSPQHTDYLILLNSTAGVIFWGCVAALAIWLVAEAPINNLLTICLKPRKKSAIAEENVNPNGYRTSLAAENKSYLSDNLPNDIYYSSKI